MSPLSKLKKLYFNTKSLYRARAIEHRKTSKLVNNIVQLSLELKQKFKTHETETILTARFVFHIADNRTRIPFRLFYDIQPL